MIKTYFKLEGFWGFGVLGFFLRRLFKIRNAG